MVLGYSPMLHVEFIPRPGQMELLKAMRHTFDYLGGVPHEVLSDNASGLVRRAAAAGRPVEWNETYLDFARYFGFVPRACRPYWARGKGRVEGPSGICGRASNSKRGCQAQTWERWCRRYCHHRDNKVT